MVVKSSTIAAAKVASDWLSNLDTILTQVYGGRVYSILLFRRLLFIGLFYGTHESFFFALQFA